jgi:hypothetical protein
MAAQSKKKHSLGDHQVRVARYQICITKIPTLVYFCNENVGICYGNLVYFMVIWYILCSFGIFYGHLVYFMVIWYILWSFGIHILWTFGMRIGDMVYFVVI